MDDKLRNVEYGVSLLNKIASNQQVTSSSEEGIEEYRNGGVSNNDIKSTKDVKIANEGTTDHISMNVPGTTISFLVFLFLI